MAVVFPQRSGQRISSEQNFDAWGRRRNPTTWAYSNPGTRPDWLIRGFTRHEHLDVFNLIHMNARLYDPLLSRMLSPDNYVVDPDATQAYNRYSYCLNNPLKYVDPDGNIPVPIIIGVAIGMYLGGSVANNNFNPVQWERSAKTFIGMGIGGIVGGFGGAGVGALLKAGKGAQVLSSAYSGGLNMFYNYSPDQSVGAMLGYFAAGFGAGMIGASAAGAEGAVLAKAKALGMLGGALGNTGVAYLAGDLTDGYTLAQALVGGALVGYAGTSYYAKKAGMKGKYLFKSKADKIFERGLSNVASNFAFTDKSEYTKMSFHGRFGAPFAYGVVGYLADEVYMPFDAIKGLRNKNLGAIIGTSMYSFGFSTEYIGMIFSKGYYDEFKDAKGGKWKKKAAIIGWKSVFYGLTLY